MNDTRTRIAIDPGVKTLAYAFSEGPRILKARLIEAKFPAGMRDPFEMAARLVQLVRMDVPQANEVHIERPAYQASRPTPVRFSDLLDLSVTAGCFSSLGDTAKSYTPQEWKGSIPKDKHHPRVAEHFRMFGDSRERNIWNSLIRVKDHNVKDALALSLFVLGRMKRGGES